MSKTKHEHKAEHDGHRHDVDATADSSGAPDEAEAGPAEKMGRKEYEREMRRPPG